MKERQPESVLIGSAEASIEFGPPEHAADGSGSRIPLRMVAPGVDVSIVIDVESWSGGTKSLIDYFRDLSGAWRGWSGPKEWSDDGPNVSISATHDGIGHVKLGVTAESHSGWDGEGSWTVTVRVPVEPGALETVATKVRALLATEEPKASGEQA